MLCSSGDCGIFVIKLAELMANGMAVNSFDKFDILHFREQLAVDLWNWSRQLHGGTNFIFAYDNTVHM